jgi:acyl-CoA thioesterase-2
VFTVERTGRDTFRAWDPSVWLGSSWWPVPAVHGGQLIGQGLSAALSTASFAPQSLHAYFLRAADPRRPIQLFVTRLKDGAAFQLRRVDVAQDDRAVLTLTASFHPEEPGFDYQMPMASLVRAPENCPEATGVFAELREMLGVEVREAGVEGPGPDGAWRSSGRLWLRAATPAGDPGLDSCVLCLLSDLSVHFSIRLPVLGSGMIQERPDVTTASLDHSLWWHRPVRTKGWLLYDLHALSVHGARGLSRGVLHDRSGRLVASSTQEVLIRPRPPSPVG